MMNGYVPIYNKWRITIYLCLELICYMSATYTRGTIYDFNGMGMVYILIINYVWWMGMLYIIINYVWWMGMLYIIIMYDEWVCYI